jgi:hypothetical protein
MFKMRTLILPLFVLAASVSAYAMSVSFENQTDTDMAVLIDNESGTYTTESSNTPVNFTVNKMVSVAKKTGKIYLSIDSDHFVVVDNQGKRAVWTLKSGKLDSPTKLNVNVNTSSGNGKVLIAK